MKLGRAELRNGPDNKAGPARFDQDGDRIQLAGVLYPVRAHNEPAGVSMDESRAFRQQWLALTGPGVDVVPLWFPDQREDIWDAAGFYRVRSASWQAMPAVTESQGVIGYSATLERVPNGFAAALIEQYLTGVLRPNSQGATEGVQSVANPVSSFSSISATAVTVGTSTGETEIAKFNTGAPAESALFRCRPEDFYNGAASVEVRYSPNGAWYPLDGLQATSAATTTATRISNGLVRVGIMPGEGFTVEAWVTGADATDESAGGWSAPVVVMSALLDEEAPVRVVELSPTRATIEVYSSILAVTVTVYRGQRFAHFSSLGSGVAEIIIKRDGVDADGELSNAMCRETGPPDGFGWVFGARTSSLSAGSQPQSTAVDGVVGFAVGVFADGAVTNDVRDEFYAVSLADQSVVT